MKRYTLQRIGKLFTVRSAVSGTHGIRVIRLLVDTGSTYTILPNEVLSSIGLDPFVSRERVRLITGSGYLVVPRIKVLRFSCLGYTIEGFRVAAHTLPAESFVDGLLGMDFLSHVKAIIDIEAGEVEIAL